MATNCLNIFFISLDLISKHIAAKLHETEKIISKILS
jgi:hypothetical protein